MPKTPTSVRRFTPINTPDMSLREGILALLLTYKQHIITRKETSSPHGLEAMVLHPQDYALTHDTIATTLALPHTSPPADDNADVITQKIVRNPYFCKDRGHIGDTLSGMVEEGLIEAYDDGHGNTLYAAPDTPALSCSQNVAMPSSRISQQYLTHSTIPGR